MMMRIYIKQLLSCIFNEQVIVDIIDI